MLQIGDLANSLVMRSYQTRIKTELARLSEEVTTGQKADPAAQLSGALTHLTGVQSSLSRLQAYKLSNTEAKLIADAAQRVMGDMQTATAALGADTLQVELSTSPVARASLADKARQVFAGLVSGLNAQQAGQSLFAGAATGSPAMASADDILAALATHLAGAATMPDIAARLDDWFNTSGGGFETLAYQGAADSRQPLRLNDTASVGFDFRADDQAFRDMLKHTATAALASGAGLSVDSQMQADMLTGAGEGLLTVQGEFTALRAELGSVQEQIDLAMQRNDAAESAGRIGRNDLLAADPYDTATRLELVQSQLETLYTVTARNSRLSLVDFLR
ncbi:flagellin [Mesobacterium sp. TK19101]|uniref:Flagellin n=1 Tax=Mesobacterium hydrothermale TaxID=3111907 RepID=A0ABU6HFQ4_9RHOB|nr:flagellin [Mesobacterium sp. TK19101]MEC3861284.1 flagellin [Mesobacterium sp. TK19101]